MTVRAENGNGFSAQFKALVAGLIAILVSIAGFLATVSFNDVKADITDLQTDRKADHDTLIRVESDVKYIRATLDQWGSSPRGGN